MKTTVTSKLRDLGYTPRGIRTIHNHLFRVNKFKDIDIVEIRNSELWFIDLETGEITFTNADFYRQF